MHENERYGLKRFHAQMLLRRKPVGQLSEESVLLDLDLLPSVVSSEGLEKAQEELLTALEEKDVQVFRAEDLRRENSELRRELAKQSQGLLVLEAFSETMEGG